MKSSSVLVVPAVLAATGLAFAQQPAPQSNLESGGLKPPEAIDSSQPAPAEAAEQNPEKDLEKADKEDSGRGLEWVWLNVEAGVQHVGLDTFKSDGLVDPTAVQTTQTGFLYGAGLGLRILVFTAGVRFRMASFSDFKLWTLDAEGGLRIPIGSLEPYVNVAAGFASMGALSTDAINSPKGFDARIGVGLDWYLSNTFSIGANLSGDVLFLSRSGSGDSSNAVYTQDGSSIGAGVTGTGVVGLHF